MSNIIRQVWEFHQKFVPDTVNEDGIGCVGNDTEEALKKAHELLQFRLDFLKEETDELKKAIGEADLAGELDAYVDLVWVILGSAFIRFSKDAFEEAADEVFRANMAKVKIPGKIKIQKPQDWTPPDIEGVVDLHMGIELGQE